MFNIQYTITEPKSCFDQVVTKIIGEPQRLFLTMFRFKDPATINEQIAYDMLKLGEGMIIEHPDILSPVPVITGSVTLLINEHHIHPTPVTSIVLQNPTWKDILQEANKMLKNCYTPIGFLEMIVPVSSDTYQLIFTP